MTPLQTAKLIGACVLLLLSLPLATGLLRLTMTGAEVQPPSVVPAVAAAANSVAQVRAGGGLAGWLGWLSLSAVPGLLLGCCLAGVYAGVTAGWCVCRGDSRLVCMPG